MWYSFVSALTEAKDEAKDEQNGTVVSIAAPKLSRTNDNDSDIENRCIGASSPSIAGSTGGSSGSSCCGNAEDVSPMTTDGCGLSAPCAAVEDERMGLDELTPVPKIRRPREDVVHLPVFLALSMGVPAGQAVAPAALPGIPTAEGIGWCVSVAVESF